jgi:hypothetical protein
MPKVTLALGLGAALWVACGGRCPEPTGGAVTATSGAPGAAELAEQAEALADKTCACSTPYCAESVSAELTALLRDRQGEMTGDRATHLLAATTRVLTCRDRLGYPSDPVDMDGALGEPDGGDGSDPEPASGDGGSG